MNKTKIEWTDYSWNPITGCLHDCWYCYAKKLFTRFHRSFEPEFHPQRLAEPSKLNNRNPVKIFCCSVSDIFADWTKEKWRKEVLEAIKCYAKCNPTLTFQLLTKQPDKINKNYPFQSNTWIGVTITHQQETNKIEELKKVRCNIKFVSFEPLLGDVVNSEDGFNLEGINWIIIGRLTGSQRAMPFRSVFERWVESIIRQARKENIPIFIKDNVKWHKKIQEFPVSSSN